MFTRCMLIVCLLATGTICQVPEPSPEGARAAAPLKQETADSSTIPASELIIRYVAVPEEVDPHVFFEALRDSFGRRLIVQPIGTTELVPRSNLKQLGIRTILIQDTKPNIDRILSELPMLSEVLAGPKSKSSLVTEIIMLTHGSPNAVMRALAPFRRELSGGVANMTAIDSGILVRDTPEQVGEIKRVVAGLDVEAPYATAPSVTFTFQVLRATESGKGDAPEELARQLHNVLPSEGFSQLGVGLLRAVAAHMDVQLEMQMKDELETRIHLGRVMLDSERNIHVGSMKFDLMQRKEGHQPRRINSFTTAVKLTPNETTVIGALGEAPYFLVVRASIEK